MDILISLIWCFFQKAHIYHIKCYTLICIIFNCQPHLNKSGEGRRREAASGMDRNGATNAKQDSLKRQSHDNRSGDHDLLEAGLVPIPALKCVHAPAFSGFEVGMTRHSYLLNALIGLAPWTACWGWFPKAAELFEGVINLRTASTHNNFRLMVTTWGGTFLWQITKQKSGEIG